jgi:hypothetical protein
MAKGNQLTKSGNDVHTRHAITPCNKTYSGKQKKVDMLMKMHRKICKVCKEVKGIYNTASLQTEHGLANNQGRKHILNLKKSFQN